jgi:type IV secretion system protein VirD4
MVEAKTGPSSGNGAIIALFAAIGGVGLLWAGAALSALISGRPVPHGPLTAAVTAFAHRTDPSAAWGQPVGSAPIYWVCTVAVFLMAATLSAAVWMLARRADGKRDADPRNLAGLATRHEVAKAAGEKTLLRKAKMLRPSLPAPTPHDLGHRLGCSRSIRCWCSVEDSMVLLGPPRSGKGLHIVIPMILDAPGAVITTSTRPDNLTVTMNARAYVGPVAVFDPQRLAAGVPSATKWSPIRGCENPQTALVRAKALTTGAARGTTDSSFWQNSAEQAVRCLLHAAALGGQSAADLYRWSLSAVAANEAVTILTNNPRAATGWASALAAITKADQKQRDSVWAMVGISFAALADPRVLDAVSPAAGEGFDPETFLRRNGSLYLLGTSSGAAATAGLVGALVEDVVEVARRLAAGSPGARLDPPLSLILDEAANYPLPSLQSVISEGGGTGISTLLVLQSLAQARAVWGDHEGAALWDSAIVKIILGGGSNARDLDDLSKLIGQRQDRQATESIHPDGRKSVSYSSREVPIMEPSRLRMLPFGTAVLLLRSARPIALTLDKWTSRPNAGDLTAAKAELETCLRTANGALPQTSSGTAGLP